jgi:hypothetical protein
MSGVERSQFKIRKGAHRFYISYESIDLLFAHFLKSHPEHHFSHYYSPALSDKTIQELNGLSTSMAGI